MKPRNECIVALISIGEIHKEFAVMDLPGRVAIMLSRHTQIGAMEPSVLPVYLRADEQVITPTFELQHQLSWCHTSTDAHIEKTNKQQ